jgi:serine/threonine protein kinase
MIVDKYEVVETLGEGAFSKVLLGRDVRSQKNVVIKTEDIESEIGLLKHEASIYMRLRNVNGMLLLKWYGVVDNMRCLVLPYYGVALNSFEEVLPYPTSLNYFRQIIAIIGDIHKMGYLHRDIKAANILVNENDECKLIDFGLSTSYLGTYGEHIPERRDQRVIGSPSYISLNVHNGVNPSRRDDLESVCYVFLYLLKGYLPWQTSSSREIIGMKHNMEHYSPSVLFVVWEYIRKLTYLQIPDYGSLVEVIDKEISELR